VSPLAITLVVTAVAGAVLVLTAALARARSVDPGRPWWSYPVVWVGVCAVVTVLGAIFVPRLLGFTFVFLPFLWLRRRPRRMPRDTDHADDDR
jgi:hypothetical protein